ncbi:MAG TPA: ParB/RepB/Spo0J family partition protein, partial [Acidimicrobiia bacterium]|nr:ParB/RepB/Spo0J family partition protein [Acidimicrobiia bacterium]
DPEALEELAASIREVGVLQPIVVGPADDDDRHVLVAGERRLRAARIAGLTEIPAMIRQADDGTRLAEALIENVQREDLGALEEAAAYKGLMEDFGMTHEQVATRVG